VQGLARDGLPAECILYYAGTDRAKIEYFIEQSGGITRGDSLQIRREMYGDKVQSTANLFGRRDSKALLYRDRPYGTPVRDHDPIKLTDEGLRIARLWRRLHSVE
jgi:superfamily II DNA helicase RecQ